MNDRQKKLLQAIAVIVVGMFLYPPFQVIGTDGRQAGVGYRWIFSTTDYAVVNVGMLFAQLVGVLVVGALIYFSLKSEK